MNEHTTGHAVRSLMGPGLGCLLTATPFTLLFVLSLLSRWLDPLHGLLALGGISLIALLAIILSMGTGQDGPPPDQAQNNPG